VSSKAFNRIGDEDQEIVREVMARAIRALDEASRNDNAEAREALAKQGVEFVDPTNATLAQWNEIANTATKQLVEERNYNPTTIAMVNNLVKTYRAQQASGKDGG
jgi:TRAP-type C4-dicarboxylate transport system substrate-binding protein